MPFQPVLTRQHYQTVLISSIIAGVTFFDFAIFWYLTDELAYVFFNEQHEQLLWVDHLYLLAIFSLSYLITPLGGILIGHYGDKYGRKPALSLSLLGVALSTLAIALLPTHQQIGILAPILLIIIRLVQGMASGGVLPSIWVFATEHLPTKRLGIGCGVIMASCVLNVMLLNVIINLLDNHLTFGEMMSYGWRIIFVIGGGLDLLAMLLVYLLKETPVFLSDQNSTITNPKTLNAISLNDPTSELRQTLTRGRYQNLNAIFANLKHDIVSWWAVLKKGFLSSFLPATLLASIAVTLIAFISSSLISLAELDTSLTAAMIRVGCLLAMFFMMLGSVFYGLMADIFNPGRVLIFAGLFLILQTMMFYFHLTSGGEYLLALFAMLGFSLGLIGALPSIIVRLFPTKIRLTGTAVTYNLAYTALGGSSYVLLGMSDGQMAITPVIFVLLMGLVAIFMSFYIYYIPRTEHDVRR